MTFAEQIARSTWERLKLSREYRVRFGEETLTDILILDLAAWEPSGRLRVHQPTRIEESRTGADLEIWIRVGRNSTVHLVIQAKKLGPRGRYDHLNPYAGGGSIRQIDRLDYHASCVDAIPMYLFYNDVDNAQASSCWHCCQQTCDERQTGCTLVPSWRVRTSLSQRGWRTFYGVHQSIRPLTGPQQSGSSLPWRCFFDCSTGIESILDKLRSSHELYSSRQTRVRSNERYDWLKYAPKENAWPDWLWSRDPGGLLSRRDLSRLYNSDLDSEIVESKETKDKLESYPMPPWLPKRILLADPGLEKPAEASSQH